MQSYDDDATHIYYGEDDPRHPKGLDAGYWKTDAKIIKSHKDVGGADRSKLLSSETQDDLKRAVGLRSNLYPSQSWQRSGVKPGDHVWGSTRNARPARRERLLQEKIWEGKTIGRDKPKDWDK